MRSSATRISYAGILTRFLARYEPGTVTRRECEDFMHSASTRGKSPAIATMNARIAAISGLYRFASSYVPEGETEPLWTRALPTVGITRGKPERSYKIISTDDLHRFFQCIPRDTVLGKRDFCIFSFFFWTARRRAEVQRLLWKNIQSSSFVPSGYLYRFRGKGKHHVEDAMELPKPAIDALFDYLQFSGRLAIMQPDSPLFAAIGPTLGGNVKPDETRQLTQKGIVNRLKYYAGCAGIPHISLHMFRHLAVKIRYENGEDILSIQTLLRHSSLQTTWIYLQGLTGIADPGYSRLLEEYGHL